MVASQDGSLCLHSGSSRSQSNYSQAPPCAHDMSTSSAHQRMECLECCNCAAAGLAWYIGCVLCADTCADVLLMQEEYFQQLELSSTLYIGNLSFYTTEDQV